MAQTIPGRLTAEERLVFFALAFSYPIYLMGGLYVVGSVIGWALLGVFLLKVYLLGKQKYPIHPVLLISPIAWLWVLAMLVMLVALVIAHIDRQLGTGATIKSSVGWAKGWALLALFPLLGSMITIRPEVITRAVCIASASAVPFAFLGLLLFIVGAPGDLFMSPVKAVGGPTEAFKVSLYGINPETGKPRWQFIGPWAPAAGLLACFYLLIAFQEKNVRWKTAGIAGAVTMCLFCQSRAGWVIFFALIPLFICFDQLKRPGVWLLASVLLIAVVLLGQPIFEWLNETYTQIKESRPGSTRVRGTLARLALQRWEAEAPIWGHGVVERGPKIVEYMPIGTHHSWYGLLFVKGIVGLFALAVPLFFTSLVTLLFAHKSRLHLSAFLICLVMLCYTFFENLEILAYLYWPALLWLGLGLKATPNPLTPSVVR